MNAEESHIISRYEAIAQTTGKMLAAARNSDWVSLVAHECLCADLIDELRGSDKSRPLSHEGEARKRQIIRRLLADDAKIRELTQPWLAKLDSILSARPTTSRVVATRR